MKRPLMLRLILRFLLPLYVFSLALVIAGIISGEVLPRGEWDTLAYTTIEIGRWTNTQTYLLDTRVGISRKFPHRFNAWSPDGSQFAFAVWTGSSIEIFIADAVGQQARQMTNAGNVISTLSWSPDGTQLMYLDEPTPGSAAISILHMDGRSEPVTPLQSLRDHSPAWSPDGKRMAFRSNRNNTRAGIFMLKLDDNSLRQLSDSSFIADTPAWSPDGSYIAYTTGFRYTSEGIRIVNRNGSHARQLTTFGSSPVWSADGRRIIFLNRRQWTFYSVDVNTGKIEPFYTIPSQQSGFLVSNPAWRPCLCSPSS